MARIDRMARWIASDILRECGVEKTPASTRAVLPVCYVFAEGVLQALGELTGEMAGELAGATAVVLVPAGGRSAELVHLAEWEAELSREGPEQGAV